MFCSRFRSLPFRFLARRSRVSSASLFWLVFCSRCRSSSCPLPRTPLSGFLAAPRRSLLSYPPHWPGPCLLGRISDFENFLVLHCFILLGVQVLCSRRTALVGLSLSLPRPAQSYVYRESPLPSRVQTPPYYCFVIPLFNNSV